MYLFLKQLTPAIVLSSLTIACYADNIKTVEVTGDRIERQSIAEIDLAQYNGFESIVTREAFADRLVNVADVINAMPSVQTFTTGGMGGYTAASIRGSTGKQVNIFVDGILLSSPQSGYSNLGVIPAAIIEAIEVYPDYTPVQLSDGNLAGAINIRTRALSKEEKGGKISVGYGSFNTLKTESSFWGGNAKTDMLLAASSLSSDNDYPVSPEMFPDVTSGYSSTRENSAYAQNDVFAKMKHALNDTLNLQAMASYSSSDNELPTIQNITEPAATLDTESLRSSIGLESSKENHNWGVRVYTHLHNSEFRDLAQSLAMQSQEVKLDQHAIGTTVYVESVLADHLLNAALDIENTDIDKHNLLGSNETIQSSREKLTLAISDTWIPIEPLSLLVLVRGFHVNDKTEPGSANFSATCAITDSTCLDSTINESSTQFGSSYDVTPHWRIKGNLGRSLRIPTLAEKYGESGSYIGEPGLKSETAQSADAGIVFANRHINSELIVFGRDIDNGIYITYDARGVGHPTNISTSRINGVELKGSWFITDELSLSASGYGMDSENRSNIKSSKGKKLQGFYHNGYTAALAWTTASHSISTTYQVDDELYYTAANTAQAAQKDSLNMSYSYRLQSWTFNTAISNVLDNQYSDYNRMPSMGRFYNTTIHYEF